MLVIAAIRYSSQFGGHCRGREACDTARVTRRSDSKTVPAIRALLFASGVAALVYQAIWIKQLSLVVGVDVYAVTIGISGFFAGLAGGAALFGRIADRVERPLLLYAVIEVGIAVAAVAATSALSAAPTVFVAMQDSVGWLAWSLPFGLVAVPAILMGGTLPPLLASIRPSEDRIGREAGRLYAANTAGAIVGALLTIFVVVPAFGIFGAALFAASLNLLLALAAFAVLRSIEIPTAQRREPRDAPTEVSLGLALYAVAGGIALGYEVVWTQVIVQFLSTRAVAFGVVLATYLTGLVLGSWFFARTADRVSNRWSTFGFLIAGAGIAAVATFWLLGPWLLAVQDGLGDAVRSITGSRMLEMCARFAVAATFLILPSTILLGAAFPAAARLIVDSSHAGRDVGYVLALNTAFGIVGSVLTGFVLVPALGLAGSLGCLAVAAAVVGGIAVAKQTSFDATSMRYVAPLVVIVAVSAVVLPRDKLATMLAAARGGDVVYYDEGPAGTVAVIEQQTPRGSFRRLYIQGVSNSGDVMPSRRYMRLQALLPLIVHPGEPESAMVIAFGTGITAGSLLAYPDLERRVVVELLQPVIDAATLFDGNFGAGEDPRLEVVVADGRHELMRREETYDLITLEPPPPAAAGVVNLYSSDFYELAKSRLNENGLLAQWLPIATQNDEDTQSLVRSMLDVFPYVTLWTTEVHEMMMIGSLQPQAFDFDVVSERIGRETVAAALQEVGINSTADLLATYITDQSGLLRYAGGALPVTDDRPRIEYAPWVRSREILRVLPKFLALSQPVPVTADAEEAARIDASYRRLLAFYEAAYRSYGDDRSAWSERRIDVQRGPPNAYFDWFFLEE